MAKEKQDQNVLELPEIQEQEQQKAVKILEEDILRAREELHRGYRDVTVKKDGKDVELRMIRSTKEIEAQAENVYASKYFEILSKHPGVPTEQQVLDVLKTRGIWSDENEARGEEIAMRLAKIRNTVYKIQKGFGGGDARAFAAQIEKLEKEREELLNEKAVLDKKRDKFMHGTAEKLAGEARRQFVMRHCILDRGTDRPFWEDDDGWIASAQSEADFWSECTVQLMLFWSALPGGIEGALETFSDGSPDKEVSE